MGNQTSGKPTQTGAPMAATPIRVLGVAAMFLVVGAVAGIATRETSPRSQACADRGGAVFSGRCVKTDIFVVAE